MLFSVLKESAAKEKLEIVFSALVPAFTQEFRSGRQGEAGGGGGCGLCPSARRPAHRSFNAGGARLAPFAYLPAGRDIFKQTPLK